MTSSNLVLSEPAGTAPSWPACLERFVDRTGPFAVPADVVKALPIAIDEHRRALVPASREDIAISLGRLALHFQPPDMPPAAWEMVLADYLDDFAELPPDILQKTMREARRSCRYWPRISELWSIAESKLDERRSRLRRLQAIQRQVEREAQEREAEAQREAQRRAEHERLLAMDPAYRLRDRWFGKRPKNTSLPKWFVWLRDCVPMVGEAVADQWHQEAIERGVEDWMPHLRMRFATHMGTVPEATEPWHEGR